MFSFYFFPEKVIDEMITISAFTFADRIKTKNMSKTKNMRNSVYRQSSLSGIILLVCIHQARITGQFVNQRKHTVPFLICLLYFYFILV